MGTNEVVRSKQAIKKVVLLLLEFGMNKLTYNR